MPHSSSEFEPLLEDPAAQLTATQIKEWGIAEIWEARGDPDEERFVRSKWRTMEREFPEYVTRVWYAQKHPDVIDPHQPKRYARVDAPNWQTRYSSELSARPVLDAALNSCIGSDLGPVFNAFKLSKLERLVVTMHLDNRSWTEISDLTDTDDANCARSWRLGISKIKDRGNLLIDDGTSVIGEINGK